MVQHRRFQDGHVSPSKVGRQTGPVHVSLDLWVSQRVLAVLVHPPVEGGDVHVEDLFSFLWIDDGIQHGRDSTVPEKGFPTIQW